MRPEPLWGGGYRPSVVQAGTALSPPVQIGWVTTILPLGPVNRVFAHREWLSAFSVDGRILVRLRTGTALAFLKTPQVSAEKAVGTIGANLKVDRLHSARTCHSPTSSAYD